MPCARPGGGSAGPPGPRPTGRTSSRRTRTIFIESRRTGHGCSAVVSTARSGSGPRARDGGRAHALNSRTRGCQRPGARPPRDSAVAEAAPTMEGMADSTKRVLLAAPRGYCAGVDRAVVAVEKALELYGAPVYVRKQIVHNKSTSSSTLERARGDLRRRDRRGARGRARDLLRARRLARRPRRRPPRAVLRTIDATCPLVTKVHKRGDAVRRRRLRHPAHRPRGPRGGRRHRRRGARAHPARRRSRRRRRRHGA